MNRFTRSIGWIAIAVFAAAIFVVNPLSETATRFAREVTIGTGALYGTLRVANSVMSVAKDADVSGGVGLASVTASPGQLLQPVTNTIDRMADLLFYLAIASGILSVVLAPVAKVTAVCLAVLAILQALFVLTARRAPPFAERLSRSALVVCLIGTVVLPASYTVAFHAGEAITDEAWRSAITVFQRLDADYETAEVRQQVEALRELPLAEAAPVAPADEGILDRLGSAVDASRSALAGTLDAATGLAGTVTGSLSANARIITDGVAISADLFTASIGIAVAYLVKLLVLPLMIFAAGLYLLRAAFR
ncbi:MAG: hypothetical protein ACK4N1_16265 [Pseudorhizobium sp.]